MESANALLKTLEEPGERIHFFIIVSSAEIVAPTLRSRLTVIDVSSSKENKESIGEELLEIGRKFLAALPNKRLETVKNCPRKATKKMNCFRSRLPISKKIVQFLNVLEFLLEKELNNRRLDIECPSGLKNYLEAGSLSPTEARRPK